MEEFRTRLRQRLAELDWSGRTLARHSGINVGTISHALHGTRRTSEATARALAEVLRDPGLLDVHRRAAGAGPPPVPTQLPRRSWITGRDALLDEAVEFALATPRAAIILTGPGGIGKTATAIELGYRLAEHTPHGQLFGDFLGWTPGHRGGADITAGLASWCRALGGNPTGDPQQVRALWREITRQRRLLVVADNVNTADREEAAEIGLPHPATITLVTSRDRGVGGHRADDDSVLRRDLGPLDDDARVHVLVRRSGLRADHVTPLVHATGGIPLVLAGIGTQLARHTGLDEPALSGIIVSMTDDLLHPGDPLWATINGSYESLDDDVRTAWRRCAQLGPVVPLPVAAALLHVRPAEARRLLDDAVGASLLDTAGAGYHYLDLHLKWARTEPVEHDPAEAAAGLHRSLAWLAGAFAAAGDILAPGRAIAPEIPAVPGAQVTLPTLTRSSLLTWCDSLWTVWPSHVRAALGHGEADWAWRLLGAALNYALLRKQWTEWDEIAAEIAAALPAEHHAGQGWCAHTRATIAGERGALEHAIVLADRAVAHRREIDDPAGLGWSLLTLARWLVDAGAEHDRAEAALDEAIDAHQRADVPNGPSLAYVFRANNQIAAGDLTATETALDHAEAAIPDTDTDPTLLASLHETRARLRLAQQRLDDAGHALTLAHHVAETADDTWSMIGILDTDGHLAIARGEPDAARDAWKQAAILADHLRDPRAPDLTHRAETA